MKIGGANIDYNGSRALRSFPILKTNTLNNRKMKLNTQNFKPTTDLGNDANRLLAAAVCPKCRTKDFDNCHSVRCPMRKEDVTVKSDWDLRKFFEQMRFDKNHHLGLGDIRLTIAQQEEICELVERFYRCT
jgi:hypothetical protein